MGALLAILFFPLLEFLEKRKLPPFLGSGLITLALTLLCLLPFVFLILWAVQSGLQEFGYSQFIENFMSSEGVKDVIDKITSFVPLQSKELLSIAKKTAMTMGLRLADGLGNFLAHLPAFGMALAVTVLSIYFFLLDGRKLILLIRRNSFFNPKQTEIFLESVGQMCRSVILAAVLSGFVQSLVFSLSCLGAKVSSFALIGFLVFLFSFVPLIGSVPVTFGLAFYQILIGNKTAGIFLVVMALVVSILDNFIRPMVLKGAGGLHPLLGFIAAFGGFEVLGFSGIFLGPIIAGIFVSLMQILFAPEQD